MCKSEKGEIDTGITLDLIITHYKEPFSVGKPLFDMIGLQRNINFEDVSVILVNDGEENKLSDELFKDYPYRVENMAIPHGGVSRARNAGLQASKADWVIFCDFDDQICNTLGLQLVYSAISEDNKDMYWTKFLEEVPVDGAVKLQPHQRDVVFIHGKIFRRQWLLDNNIRFHNGLTLHEDVFFNQLAQAIATEERIGAIETGWYLWCSNPNSVGRSYGETFLFDTYDHLLKQRNEMAKEFRKRDMETQVKIVVSKTIIDGYYDFQTTFWRDKKHEKQFKENERWFCTFLKRYGVDYSKCDSKAVALLGNNSRDYHFKNGAFLMECETLGGWLKHLMNDVKPFDISVLDVEE